MVVNALSTASEAFGYGSWAKMCGISPSRHPPAQPALGGHSQKNSVQTTNMTVFQNVQIQLLELAQGFRVGGGGEDPRFGFVFHVGRHGRKRVNPRRRPIVFANSISRWQNA